MWKKIKDHIKANGQKYILALLGILFGADKAQEYGVFASVAEPYEVAASFYVPDGGGAFPAFQDDAGPVLLEVVKPSPAIVQAVFEETYGDLYPGGKVRSFIIVKAPDKGAEPEPDEPEETQ